MSLTQHGTNSATDVNHRIFSRSY